MKFALDTSCLVACLADWHEHHERTRSAVEARWQRGQETVIPVHAVVETYSVLTRLPEPLRADPTACERALRSWFADVGELQMIPAKQTWDFLKRHAEARTSGGRIYDALVAESAARGGASVLLTWNPRHFLALAAPLGIEVREP